MNRLPASDRAQILHALCEGMSMRSCERVFRRSLGTIVKIVEEVGDMAIQFHKTAPKCSPKYIQIDELWSFIGRNDHGYKPEERVEAEGVSWTYLGVDPDTKLVVDYHIGTRHAIDATAFMRKLANRLARREDGSLLVKPSLAFDGLVSYPDAVELAFGDEVNAGVFEKVYDERHRYIGSNRKSIKGSLERVEINTWRVERENGFMRQANRRFARKTNAFSKRLEFHERQIAIWMMYRNYCWEPFPGRPRDGSSKWQVRRTAAEAAGLTDQTWKIDRLIELSDEFRANRVADESGIATGPSEVAEEARFWVNHSPNHRRAKVHDATCTTRNKALANPEAGTGGSIWRPFSTQEDAVAFAARLEPDHHEVCRRCLGTYKMLSTYGRRR